MRFLDRLFETKASSGDAVRRASSGMTYQPDGRPYKGEWDTDRVVKEAYERSIWVYRAIDAIASNASRLKFHVRVDGSGDIVENKPLDKMLNRRTNPHETAANFKFRLSCQLLLCKQGVFVELVRSRAGDVVEMYLLPAGRTWPIPDQTKFVSGYEVRLADGSVYALPAEDVVWIRKPHPTDPYMGTTPLEAAGLSIDLDFYTRMYNRTFMQNDGRPGGLIGIKGTMNRDDAEAIKRRFSGGVNNAGRTTVIEADDINWVDTATTPRDAQYSDMRSATKEEILLAFGTPESVIGNAASRTFANADAEFDVFWRVTMMPHLDLIAGALEILTGDLADDNILVYDVSGVAVLQRDENARDKKALDELTAGAITIDEYLKIRGHEPLDVPMSRVRWVPASKIPVAENDEDLAAVLAVMSGQPQAPPDDPNAIQTAVPAAPGLEPGIGSSALPERADVDGGDTNEIDLASLGVVAQKMLKSNPQAMAELIGSS